MDIPASVAGSIVSEGEIFIFSKDCPVGIPEHRHVCIKHHEKYILLSTCSSRTATSYRLAVLRNWDLDTFPEFLPDVKNKFTKPTYINCNTVIELTEEEFGRLIKERKIFRDKRGGVIDEEGMCLIADGILKSTEVDERIRDLFKKQ